MIKEVEFQKLRELRRHCGVYPTDADAKFFEKPRARNQRNYYVRSSVETDDYAFISGKCNPIDFITIVFRANYGYVVLPADSLKYGPVVDCDGYARLRLDAYEKEAAHAS